MTGETEPRSQPVPIRLILLILLADALFVLPCLSNTTLWETDEGRISAASRSMAESGDWIVPRIAGKVFGSYPPLEYWMIVCSAGLFGWNEFAVRLPNAMAGVLLVGLLALFAWRLTRSRAVAGWAAMVLALTPGFLSQQTMARADVMMAFFILAAVFLFFEVAEHGGRLPHVLGFYVCLALAVLTKGPLGLILAGLAIVPWLGMRRRWDLFAAMKPWWGVPLFLGLVVPWYGLFFHYGGPAGLRMNLVQENFEAFHSGFQHAEAWTFYLARFPLRAAPWILAALLLPFVPETRRETLPGWLAAVAVFILLMISSAKRANYLVYVYPWLAVALGGVLRDLADLPRLRRVLAGFGGAIMLGGAGTVLTLVFFFSIWTNKVVVSHRTEVTLVGAVVFAAGLLVVWLNRRESPRGALATTGALVAAVMLFYSHAVRPAHDEEGRSGVVFSRSMERFVPTGHPIGGYRIESEAYFVFYATRPVREYRDFEEFKRMHLLYGLSPEGVLPPGVTVLTSFSRKHDQRWCLWKLPSGAAPSEKGS